MSVTSLSISKDFCDTFLYVSNLRPLRGVNGTSGIDLIDLIVFWCASGPDFLAVEFVSVERIYGSQSYVSVLKSDHQSLRLVFRFDNYITEPNFITCCTETSNEGKPLGYIVEHGSVDRVGPLEWCLGMFTSLCCDDILLVERVSLASATVLDRYPTS